MGATCRVQVQGSCFVAVRRNLCQSPSHDPAFAGLQIVQRTQLTRCDILGEALQRSDILRQEILRRLERDTAGRVDILPGMILA